MGLFPLTYPRLVLLMTLIHQGTYLGTLSDVNHLDLVGWINTARYKWAEIMGKQINFKPDEFYLGIADMLAREVEGLSDADEDASRPAGADAGEGEAQAAAEDVAEPAEKETEEREQMIQSLDRAGAGVLPSNSDPSGSSTSS